MHTKYVNFRKEDNNTRKYTKQYGGIDGHEQLRKSWHSKKAGWKGKRMD